MELTCARDTSRIARSLRFAQRLLDYGGVLCRFTQPGTRGYFDTAATIVGGMGDHTVGERRRSPPPITLAAAVPWPVGTQPSSLSYTLSPVAATLSPV